MPRICTICVHPEREEIDKALLNASSGYRAVAKSFEVSQSSLYRHRTTCLPKLLARGLARSRSPSRGRKSVKTPTEGHVSRVAAHSAHLAEREEASVIDVTQQLRAINAACLEVLRVARADGKLSILLQATDRIVRQIELQAKLLGQISDAQTVNIAILPEWQSVRQRVLQALEPYPEARIAVAQALLEGED